MRRATLKGFGMLVIVGVASLPLIVCSGTKPTQETTQPQPAASVPASPQPAAAGPAEVAPEGGPATAGDVTAGRALFVKNCALCHNADSAVKKIGPGLKDLFKHKELPMGDHPTSEANVRNQI